MDRSRRDKITHVFLGGRNLVASARAVKGEGAQVKKGN